MMSSLRELGAADLGVGRRIKHMTESLNGRIQAYERGLMASDNEILFDALRRNLFGTVTAREQDLVAMAAYIRDTAADLGLQDLTKIIGGSIEFRLPITRLIGEENHVSE